MLCSHYCTLIVSCSCFHQSLRNVTSTSSGAMDTDLIVDKSEVSLGVLKAQELLAESWRTLLVVAANHHVREIHACTCIWGNHDDYMYMYMGYS